MSGTFASAEAQTSWLANTPAGRARLDRARNDRAGLAGWIGIVLLLSAEVSGRATIANGLIGIAAVVALVNLARIRRTSLFVLPYVGYVLLLSIAVNSFPTTLPAINLWLNRDGRIFIAVLPFIALGTLRVRWADLRLFVKAMQVFVWVDVMLFLGGVAGPIRHLVMHRTNFIGLTSSHHACGYFASGAMLILYAARRSPQLGVRPSMLTIAAAAGILIASNSRTSLLGLGGVAVWALLSKRKASDIVKVVAIAAAVAAVVLAIGSRFLHTVSAFFSPSFRHQSIATFEAGLKQNEGTHYVALFGSNPSYIANMLARFWYWGIAIGLFLRSPILGIGSFRFNDINLHFSGIPYLFDFATSGVDNSADLEGAHDQFFGALVETGIVGLVLLLMMWILPYRQLRRSVNKPYPIVQSGCQMVPFAFATAFTGYTLAAPSLTFVAMTWLAFTTLVEDPEGPPGVPVERPAPIPEKSRRRRRGAFVPRRRASTWTEVRPAE